MDSKIEKTQTLLVCTQENTKKDSITAKTETTNTKRNPKKKFCTNKVLENKLLELKVSNQLKRRTNPWLMIPHDVS